MYAICNESYFSVKFKAAVLSGDNPVTASTALCCRHPDDIPSSLTL